MTLTIIRFNHQDRITIIYKGMKYIEMVSDPTNWREMIEMMRFYIWVTFSDDSYEIIIRDERS
jgi:hypothetical protein